MLAQLQLPSGWFPPTVWFHAVGSVAPAAQEAETWYVYCPAFVAGLGVM